LKATETENAELKGRCNDLGQKLAQADTLSMEAQNRAKESEKNNKNLQDHIRSQQKDKESEIQVSDSIYLLVIFRAWRCCLAHMTFSVQLVGRYGSESF